MMTNIKLTAFDFNYIVNHIYGIASGLLSVLFDR